MSRERTVVVPSRIFSKMPSRTSLPIPFSSIYPSPPRAVMHSIVAWTPLLAQKAFKTGVKTLNLCRTDSSAFYSEHR